jgi:hypothetical protein
MTVVSPHMSLMAAEQAQIIYMRPKKSEMPNTPRNAYAQTDRTHKGRGWQWSNKHSGINTSYCRATNWHRNVQPGKVRAKGGK